MIFPLVGNDNIKQTIENLLSKNKIPHAIIIDGPDGTGKQELANFLAHAAVCEGKKAPCGTCAGCRKAYAGSHPDIAVISPEQGKKTISVAQTRQLRNEAYVKAHMASRRVFIIDRADQMNEQSQNALLKVLEEPPGDIVFILIARARAALLSTIISRCVVFSLCAPNMDIAQEYIVGKTGEDSQKVQEALNSANGNIGVALNFLSNKKRSEQSQRARAKEFLQSFLQDNQLDMLKILHPLEKDRVATEEFFGVLQICIVERLRAERKSGRKARILSALYEEIKKYMELLKTNANLSLLFCCLVCKSKQF